jgi:hypothetical protein
MGSVNTTGLCYPTRVDPMALRRARGFLLRLVRQRGRAVVVGLLLAVPAAWLEFRSDAWWTEGLALVVGATGLALFWTGLTGASPDWIDEDDPAARAED